MRHAAGLDLGGTNLKYGIVDDGGAIVHRGSTPSRAASGPGAVLETMAQALAECVDAARASGLELAALGAGIPGAVDTERGVSLGDVQHIPDWGGVEVGAFLAARTPLPVFVDNDGKAMVFAETMAGAAKGAANVVGLTLGTGIGGGIVLGGELHRGRAFSAGEIGHMVVEAGGEPCPCGNRGCLTMYCGGSSFGGDPREVFEAAERGDDAACAVIERVVFYLGAGLTSIVNLLNPDVVVIGGGISDAGDAFVARVADEVRRRALEPMNDDVQIVRAKLGNDAGLIGAALLALRNA